MSRQIKFRAFDKDNGKMHYFSDMPTEIGEWYLSFGGKVYERHDDMGGDFEVEGIELMQFTGLLDKNGKEIYEGDCVNGMFTPQVPSYHGNNPKSFEFTAMVVFDDGAFLYQNINKGKGSKAWNKKRMNGTELSSIEIIGNIYENPELIK